MIYQTDLVAYGLNGKVNVDRQQLRDAIKKDVIGHPKEFASAEARDFKSDLADVLPEAQANEVTAMLRRASDDANSMHPVDGMVSLHKFKLSLH